MRDSRVWRRAALGVTLIGVLALAMFIAACGDSTESDSTSSASPAASPSATSAAATIAEYTLYYQQVKPIFDQVSTAVSSLDNTVQGLSDTPNKSWTKSANKMDAAAQELTEAAAALEAVTPPAALESVQADVVTALEESAKILTDTAAYLDERVADPNMPDVKTTIEQEVKAKLTEVLQAAAAEVMAGISGATAAPTAAP